MSHSSGIDVSDDLSQKFGQASQSDNVRLFKVQITSEVSLDIAGTESTQGDWENDFKLIQNHLEDNVATYILYRLDSENSLGKEWVLFSFVPDRAPVRQKMLYSSTKSTLKQKLGVGRFSIEIHGTVKSDLSLQSYQKYLTHKHAEAPLTQSEIDRKDEEEQGIFVGGSGTGSITNSGVAFPFEEKVVSSLKSLSSDQITYVQIIVDTKEEKILLGSSSSIGVSDLPSQISTSEPRFHFFRYKHTHEGSSLSPILFIYSCPDGSGGTKSAPVKQRMLYSSSKSHISFIAQQAGVNDFVKIEVNKGEELSEQALNLLLHPPVAEEKTTFSKPTKPGRGPPRLNRKK